MVHPGQSNEHVEDPKEAFTHLVRIRGTDVNCGFRLCSRCMGDLGDQLIGIDFLYSLIIDLYAGNAADKSLMVIPRRRRVQGEPGTSCRSFHPNIVQEDLRRLPVCSPHKLTGHGEGGMYSTRGNRGGLCGLHQSHRDRRL